MPVFGPAGCTDDGTAAMVNTRNIHNGNLEWSSRPNPVIQANCTCGPDQFQCQWGGGCVAQELRCNGKFDCVDRSDELGCREVKAPGLRKEMECMKLVEFKILECGDWSLSEDHMRWLIKGDRQEDSGIQWPTVIFQLLGFWPQMKNILSDLAPVQRGGSELMHSVHTVT